MSLLKGNFRSEGLSAPSVGEPGQSGIVRSLPISVSRCAGPSNCGGFCSMKVFIGLRPRGCRRWRLPLILDQSDLPSLLLEGSHLGDEAVVDGLRQLALRANVPLHFLSDVASRRMDPYEEFHIPKRGGSGTRVIAAPTRELGQAQRWILDNILAPSTHSGREAYAYSKGSSIKGCAQVHAGATWLIKLDLKDFFGSIREPRVMRIFQKIGVSAEFSSDLARLCTRASAHPTRPDDERSALSGHLPQGAPSSGMLANMAASDLDGVLRDCAGHFALRYTRYADDLLFSSTRPFSRDRAWRVVRQVRSKVAAHQFTLNEDKVRIRPPGSRLVVLGLLVDSERPRLRPDFKRTLGWHLHGSERFGIDRYSESRGFESIEGYLRHVDGLFSHAIDIEPEWAGPLREEWNSISSAPDGRLLATPR